MGTQMSGLCLGGIGLLRLFANKILIEGAAEES